ncbi:hypothetical protein Q5H92_10220 [Hymenobacter sp. M29]|uniref:Glycosyltransferase RgtA/B/C/D-like domain-containing protein n=1 Tax=Hymenobacter mellowenesis TaxID=3063995 RepID=A0ABT9AA73_9BACT|nr:hypothetical protein [Hymenobacter sp. M29]MDO7846732.1 hypothetical protein [Hymenobacter sp. M29]
MVNFQQAYSQSSWSLKTAWPIARYICLVFVLYLIYLPFSGYNELIWDAKQYWEAVSRFFLNKSSFSLLNYNFIFRGYMGPLLVMPVRVVCTVLNLDPMYGSKLIGMVWAAILFGFAIPKLWQVTTGVQLIANRWLLLTTLCFVFWGDYFNYCLQDFPAFTILLLALIALSKPKLVWIGYGGVLLAMCINMRPIYMASIPGVLGWFWWQTQRNEKTAVTITWWAQSILVFVLGIILVLLPQILINYRHFHQLSPFVLVNTNQHLPFYLIQLNWGLAYQRYDTSTNPLHFGAVFYGDREGVRELAAQTKGYFESYGAFAKYFLTHPLAGIGHYLRHLFNGLDVDYRAPYPAKIVAGHITGLQLLNYNVVTLGIVWLAYQARKSFQQVNYNRSAVLWLVVVLLIPVAIAIPTAVEVRFLIPLHLLLLASASAALCSFKWRQQTLSTYLAIGAVIVVVTWGGSRFSANTQAQLLSPNTAVTDY